MWDKTADAFRFSGEHLLDILSSNRNTKRSVLQASARIFDPLGFLAPYVIRVKMLFQRMWQQGLGWDEELPDELREEWAAWCSELVDLRMVISPRCLLRVDGDLTELQLRVFSDASPQAYGACAYLRAVNSAGDVSVNLIVAKARVAPLKTLSLPRLELMGAPMGARLAAFLRASVFDGDIEVSYWSDSMITLGWIKGTTVKWKPFVCNRVTEIQASSDRSSWHHCPGNLNPADLMTRGKTVVQLSAHKGWWFGPNWLVGDRRDWPVAMSDCGLPGDIEVERRQKVDILLTAAIAPTLLLTVESFGSYKRLLQVTAWILRFVRNGRGSTRSQELSCRQRK
ncbi:uncharacterized protein LOC121835341 [Ixodes scapularis]|uniref:uncharacterized protein LOC121835341 n=1 Tax=Ixodes scapularis TaxID=6945 RepID=UPI001C3932BC|nr:uncharacterized protein LOC121835341 [Ixodes scapularis]